MVPSGWELSTFNNAGIIVTDGDRGKEYPKAIDFFEDEYCLFLSAKNVTKQGFLFEDNQFITEAKHRKLRKGTVNKGDVVLTTRGSVGHFALYDDSVGFKCMRINSGMVTLNSSNASVESDYFYTVCRSYLISNQIKAVAFGSAQPQLTVKLIKNLKLPVPPLSEQRKIAKILSTWDKAITTTEKLIETSKQQKKALMQQLLTGKKRLVNPETGKVFEGEWEEFKLGELFAERVETKRDDLPLLSITSSDGVVYQEDTGRKNTSNDDKSKYRRICVNDIGYNTMRMWQGRSSISNKEGIVSPAYTILIPQQNVAPMYASYLFKLPRLVHVFERNSQGLVSDTWNLKYPHFAKIKWSFPCLKEQQKIAAILTAADKEIEVLEAKLSHFKQEKKALMQQLLTGKRRVSLSS